MRDYRRHRDELFPEKSRPSQRIYPAISEVEDAMRILGIRSKRALLHLVKTGRLLTLSDPKKGRWKRFATAYLLELVDDADWLREAQRSIDKMWEKMNAKKRASRKEKPKPSKQSYKSAATHTI